MGTVISSAEISEIVQLLDGTEKARTLAIACFALLLYEYIITLDREIEYFWNGHWTMSRALYLVNRYLPIIVATIVVFCFCVPNPTVKFSCDRATRIAIVLEVIALAVIQAILVLRVWYMFSRNLVARWIPVVSYVVCTALTVTYVAISFGGLHAVAIPIAGLRVLGCTCPPPERFWRFFVPALILHAILFVCTTVHAISTREFLHSTPVMRRLLRDGGLFYMVVFVVATFSTAGAFLDNNPSINIPAIYSGIMLAIMAVSISRVMLNIHSLASHLNLADVWLLNHGELSRVQWKPGARAGELIVEVDTDVVEMEPMVDRDRKVVTPASTHV